MKYAFATTLFFLVFIALELIYSLFRKPDARTVNKAVERYTNGFLKDDETSLLYNRKFSDIKILNKILAAIPAVHKLDEIMQQGGVKILAGVFILISLALGSFTFLFCSLMQKPLSYTIAFTSLSVLLPYVYLLYKREQRKLKFETIFPDALDLMGYSLKAGHSVMASFKMVADEMADPVGEEFNRIVDEINFGLDLDSTLRNFSRRIDSPELKFFVTSVIIQRETGGNLVELLGRISAIIRKKFRFREKVKTLTGEGKLSAIILASLPFLVGTALTIFNPKYVRVLFNDPIGHYMIAIASVMVILGALIMYKLVQLDM